MQPKCFLLFISIFIFSLLSAQTKQQQTGSISGSVTEGGNGIALAGSTINLDKIKKTAVADADGKFKIDALPPGTYVATISYVGYEKKQIEGIIVKAGEISSLDVTLNPAQSTLKEVVVKSDARKENIAGVLNIRKNSSVVSDIISADQIRRSPDKSTSDVLKRISGTTIQENKFVVVRGMSDRYNEAMLNGALLPSSEPDRKTFAFDIFPAEVVDNITIVKTASPDLPGSFSGGVVQINTKDAVDKDFIGVKAGIGYNSITTGKTFYKTQGSSTDWLGYDNTVRKLPDNFPEPVDYYNLPDKRKEKFSKEIPNLWPYDRVNAPTNTTIQLTGGFSTTPRSKSYPKISGIGGVIYNSAYTFNNTHRNDFTSAGNVDTVYKYNDSVFTRSILESVLADFSVRINQNNKFFFNNILSITSSDQTVFREGYSFSNQWDVKANSAFFVSNRILNTQLGGDHYFPKQKFRIKWLAFYTDMFRNEPDYRRNQYVNIGGDYFALITQTPNSSYGSHYYATVKDKTKGLNIDLIQPFKLFNNTQIFKIGAALYDNNRAREARTISAKTTSNFNSGPQGYLYWGQDTIFRPRNFNANNGFLYEELPDSRNHYDGSVNNAVGYAMLDNRLTQKLRLVWGVRYENYHQTLNTFNDAQEPLRIDTTYHDLLPSANLIYSVLRKANIRLSYSKTVARPQYRELAPALFYDFLTNVSFYGNPGLTETHVQNYDIRWEHYFANSQYYSVSGFYKKFTNPIEQFIPFGGTDSKTVSTRNDTTANNYGIELEGRSNFGFISKVLEPLVAYTNLSFIKSRVAKSGSDTIDRPLQGQSPYIINFGLQYTEPKTNLAFSALYNAIGDRLFLVGSEPGQGADPVWERPRPTLDFKLSKTFLKNNGLIEFSAADVLHKNDILYYDQNSNRKYDPNVDRIVSTKTNGMRWGLSISYRF